jgi:hypothetical protein
MLNKDELLILTVAAADSGGEYSVLRDWNKQWGAEYAAMKNLEAHGFMKIKSAGRVPHVNQWSRQSTITDTGRAALVVGERER